jgi:hypothetical protein
MQSETINFAIKDISIHQLIQKTAQLTANKHLSVYNVPPTCYGLWMAIIREASDNGRQ